MSLTTEAWKLSFSVFSTMMLFLFTFLGLFGLRLPCCPWKFPIYMISRDGILTSVGKALLIFGFSLLGQFLANLLQLYMSSTKV